MILSLKNTFAQKYYIHVHSCLPLPLIPIMGSLTADRYWNMGWMWLHWSHHCIYVTNDHINVRVSFRSIYICPFSSVLCGFRFGSCFICVIFIYFRILVSNTIHVSSNPSGAPLLVSGVHVVLSLVFCIMFYGSLFVLCDFSFALCVVFPFDLRLLIIPLVSSDVSHLSMW
jgi:hypothetical protein